MRISFRKNTQKGLSLIELMIGMAIGLVLVAGLTTLFSNSSGATNELEKSIRQFENGRYAVDLLNEDIRHAGFYGEVLAGLTTPSYELPSVCATAIANLGWTSPDGDASGKVPMPVNGLTSAEVQALTCLPNHKLNTPAIALRRLETFQSVGTAAIAAALNASAPSEPKKVLAKTGSVYVQASQCPRATTTYTIFAANGTTTPFKLLKTDCTADTSTTPPTIAGTANPLARGHIARVYYIASCNECGIDTTPTLKRADLVGTQIVVTPMVEGIDDMAFEFGFDTNTAGDTTKFDGIPDEYRTGLSGTVGANNNNWKNVVSVRTYILSRNTETTPGFTENKTYSLGLAGTRGPFTDNIKRRSYSITSNLTNVSGIRDGS